MQSRPRGGACSQYPEERRIKLRGPSRTRFLSTEGFPLHEKCTHTPAANRISGNVELASKLQRDFTVNNAAKGGVMKIAERAVKKTGPEGTVRFDHGRHPRCVAAWRHRWHLAQVRLKMQRDAAELFGFLGNEA